MKMYYPKYSEFCANRYKIKILSKLRGALVLTLFNDGDRLLRLGASLSSEDFNLNARTNEVLAPVHKPLDSGDDKDDTECRNTVVCNFRQMKRPTYSCCYQWQAVKGGKGKGWWSERCMPAKSEKFQ